MLGSRKTNKDLNKWPKNTPAERTLVNTTKVKVAIGKSKFVPNKFGGEYSTIKNPKAYSKKRSTAQDISKYPPSARKSIIEGIKSGNVKFEKSKTGGEYIYSAKKKKK